MKYFLLCLAWLLTCTLQAQELKLVLPTGHTDGVHATYYSPDGKRIITTSSDGSALLWNGTNGLLLSDSLGRSASVQSVHFKKDNTSMLFVYEDNRAHWRKVSNGETLGDLQDFTPEMTGGCLLVSPVIQNTSADGRVKAVVKNENMLIVEPAQPASGGVALSQAALPLQAMAFSADNTMIALLSDEGLLQLWNISSGKKLWEIKNFAFNHIAFSPNSQQLAVSSASIGGFTRVLNASNGELVFECRGKVSRLSNAFFSNDGGKILFASWDHSARIWDTRTARMVAYMEPSKAPVVYAGFSSDNEEVIIGTAHSLVQVWDVAANRPLTTLKGYKYWLITAAFSKDKKQTLTVATPNFKEIIGLWDASTGQLIKDLTNTAYAYQEAVFDSFSTVTYVNRFASVQETFSLAKGDLQKYIRENQDIIARSLISPDKKQLLLISRYVKPNVKCWDIATGALKKTISLGPGGKYEDVHFGINYLLASRNGVLLLFDLQTGKQVYQFAGLEEKGSIAFIPSGYYWCNREAAKLLHYVTNKEEIISFDQLDIRRNRPDKVLAAIKQADTALVSAFRHAWYKRLERLGIDTNVMNDDRVSIPQNTIIKSDTITYKQDQATLTIGVACADSQTALDRFQIWVNETPVFGIRGLDIRKRNKTTFDTTFKLTLSAGKNRIETSVTNVQAMESYRSLVLVNHTPKSKPAKVFFVGIGIDNFDNNIHNLKYCTKDIRDLASALGKKFGQLLQVDTLINQQVTIENVMALKQRLANAREDDKIVIAYSGHGLLSKQYDYFLSSYNINFDQPQQQGIPVELLEYLVDSSRCRQKLMIIDACHSGELDKAAMKQLARLSKESPGPVGPNNKGIKLPANNPTLGIKGSFELMQEMFINSGRTTGTTIIAAAGGKQFAGERDEFGNGVLTHSVLQLFKKTEPVTVSQLKKYVSEEVSKLTNGLQQPVARFETQYSDWLLW